MELTKEYRWEGSHILPKHKGKCANLHGHSWKLFVSVEGTIDPATGFVMDFGDISDVVKPLIARLDHHHIGTWEDIGTFTMDQSGVSGLPWNFYPTSENLLCWIALQLSGLDLWQTGSIYKPHELRNVKLGEVINTEDPTFVKRVIQWSKLSIEETCTSRATLTRSEFDGHTQAVLDHEYYYDIDDPGTGG